MDGPIVLKLSRMIASVGTWTLAVTNLGGLLPPPKKKSGVNGLGAKSWTPSADRRFAKRCELGYIQKLKCPPIFLGGKPSAQS